MRTRLGSLAAACLAAVLSPAHAQTDPASIERRVALTGAACIAQGIWWAEITAELHPSAVDGYLWTPPDPEARIADLAAAQSVLTAREIRLVARLLARYALPAAREVLPAHEAGNPFPEGAATILRLGQSDCQDEVTAQRRREAAGATFSGPAPSRRGGNLAIYGVFCHAHLPGPRQELAELAAMQDALDLDTLTALHTIARARMAVAQAEVRAALDAGKPVPAFAEEIMRAGQSDCQEFEALRLRAGLPD